ncbi:hypothetical protein [Dysgonomonas sp.]
MKNLIFLLFLLFPFISWAQTGNKEFLVPLSLATIQIDTTSIDRDRERERVYVTILQHPLNDPIIKKEFLNNFSKKHIDRKNVVDIIRFRLRLGCDCETNDIQIYDYEHEWLEKGKFPGMTEPGMTLTRRPELFKWEKSSFESKGYSPNDAEIQLINSLCSKYIYKVDSVTYTLDIEEIPYFIQKHSAAHLQNVEREKVECNLPYKKLETFHNDTIAFLKYNFKDRTICYRGTTLSQVLEDLQLIPQSYTILEKWPYANMYQGIKICVKGLNRDHVDPSQKNQCIYIYWDELLNSDDLLKLNRKNDSSAWHNTWSSEYYNLLKNNIVGGVYTK